MFIYSSGRLVVRYISLSLCTAFILSLFSAGCDNSSNDTSPAISQTVTQEHGASTALRETSLLKFNLDGFETDLDVVADSPAERRRLFYQSELSTFYREYGQPNAIWRDDVLNLIEGFSAYQAYCDFHGYVRPAGVPSNTALRRATRDILARGCDESFVKFLNVVLEYSSASRWKYKPIFSTRTEFRDDLKARGLGIWYARLDILLLHPLLETYLGRPTVDKTWQRETRNASVALFAELLTTNTELSAEDEAEYARLFDYYATGMNSLTARSFLDSVNQTANGSRWLTHTLRGTAYLYYAWAERGGSVRAHQVERSAWPRFFKLLDQAEAEYRAALALRPDVAEPAIRMITIAMGQSRGEAYEWFERAIAIDPLDTEAYRRGIWSHRVQWARDPDTVARVAKRAFAVADYRTDVPDQLERAVGSFIVDYGSVWWIKNHKMIWPELQSHLEKRSASPTPHRSPEWCAFRGFELAHRAGLNELRWMYYQGLQSIGGQLSRPYTYGVGQRWKIDRMYAEQEPAIRVALREIDQLEDDGENDAAIALIDRTLPQANHERTARHLRDTRRVNDWIRRYVKGETVNLLEHGLEGWRVARGRWQETDEGVIGRYSSRDELRMTASFRPGTRFTARLIAEVPDRFYGHGWGVVGLVLDPNMTVSGFVQNWIGAEANGNKAVMIRDVDQKDNRAQGFGKSTKPQRVLIELERWDNAVRVRLNGDTVVQRYDLTDPGPERGILGLGVWKHDPSEYDILWESLEVQKLFESPFDPKPRAPRPPYR